MIARDGFRFLLGSSMKPTFSTGDKLKVVPVSAPDVHIGDVVIFTAGRQICHRLIGKYTVRGRTFLIEKGDCQDARVGLVNADSLKEKVVEVSTGDGRLLREKDFRISRTAVLLYAALNPVVFCLHGVKLFLFGKKSNSMVRLTWKCFSSFYWYSCRFFHSSVHVQP
ncbi:MAG TPA: hypothetical protein PKL77_04940 [Candidatus Omnitrophota bacterium]|nr:hypothetical protein [Candidatus Omnitrophota bacterium]